MKGSTMTAPDTQLRSAPSAPTVDTLWKRRPVIVVVAALVPLLVWLVARVGFGLDVRSPTFSHAQHVAIGPLVVFLTALPACLLGWGLVAILERFTDRPRRIWLVVALVGLLVSLGMPLSGTGVPAGDRIALVLMHLSVGAALIPGLANTARSRP
jgi:hypothetical protein